MIELEVAGTRVARDMDDNRVLLVDLAPTGTDYVPGRVISVTVEDTSPYQAGARFKLVPVEGSSS